MAYRSVSTTTIAQRTNTTGTEPSGAAENDILIAFMYIEANTAVTPPTGWTQVVNVDHAVEDIDLFAWYIRRGASAPALTWTHANQWTQLAISAHSGRITSGDPQDVAASSNNGDSGTPTATGVTVATTGSDLLFIAAKGFNGQAYTPPTNYTERLDGAAGTQYVYLATRDDQPAGATGNISATATADDWMCSLVALRPAAAAAGSLIIPRRLERTGLYVR